MQTLALVEGLRGNYTGMAPDWTVPQSPDVYADEDQAVWRLLVERQTALAQDFACAEFLQGRPQPLLELIEGAGLTLHEIPEWHERANQGRRRDFPDVDEESFLVIPICSTMDKTACLTMELPLL